MGHIKEPEGVDFIIQSPPLSDNDKKEISSIISKMKAKNKSKNRKKTVRKQNQST